MFTPSPTASPTESAKVLQAKLQKEWAKSTVTVSLQKETQELNAGFKLEEQEQEVVVARHDRPHHRGVPQEQILDLIRGTSEANEMTDPPVPAPSRAPTWPAADTTSLLEAARTHSSFFDMIARASMHGGKPKLRQIPEENLANIRLPQQEEVAVENDT
jgi:hypothetical protein